MSIPVDRPTVPRFSLACLRTGGALALALTLVACGGGDDRPWTGGGDPPWKGTNWKYTDAAGWTAPDGTQGYRWVEGQGWVYWSSKGGSEDLQTVVCKDLDNADMPVKPKTITIRNNSNALIYPLLHTSMNSVNQWLQACFRDNAPFAATKVYKLAFNEGQGIPPDSSVTVTLPLYSKLPNGEYITWWNGGRVILADKKDRLINAGHSDANIRDEPLAVPDSTTCTGENSPCNLSLYSSNSAPPGNIYGQLAEYTFGDSNYIETQKTRLLAPQNVGYNISYVDHVYMPIAIAPKGNPYIGYSGSAQALPDFRKHLEEFMAGIGDGWPVYNLYRPLKLPSAYVSLAGRSGTVRAEDDVPVRPSGNKAPPELTVLKCIEGHCSEEEKANLRFGQAVQRIQNLWGSCVSWGDVDLSKFVTERIDCPQDLRKNMQAVKDFFEKNLEDYLAGYAAHCTKPVPIRDPKVPVAPATPGEITETSKFLVALQHIYGWVPYNKGCGADFNALAETRIDGWDHAKIQSMYIHELQYNYLNDAVKADPRLTFNPYVKLIHEDLKMNAYGFSVDDAVGFMSELGDGVIFTVGGTQGLENEDQFSYANGFEVHLGTPAYLKDQSNRQLIKKYGVCVFKQNTDDPDCIKDTQKVIMPEKTKLVSFRVGTVAAYPVKVRFTDVDDNTYAFVVKEPFAHCPLDADVLTQCPTNWSNILDKTNDPSMCQVTNSRGEKHPKSDAWCQTGNPNQSREMATGVGVKDAGVTKNHISFFIPVDFCQDGQAPGTNGCHQ